MPHLVLDGVLDLATVAESLAPAVDRFGRAVLKTEISWLRSDRQALLVEGVVVEYSRPLHPVALVSLRDDDTVVRLWSIAAVERTPAVQRWLCLVAAQLRRLGAGPLVNSNIPEELSSGLGLADARPVGD